MKKLITLLLCAATLSSIAQTSSTIDNDERFKGLDTAFQRVLKNWHAAGFAVAIIEKNKVVYAKGFGYRDLKQHLPVTPNTLFAIGSCSKAFTAALIGKLEQDGKLDIDKPVVNYLPSLKFYNDAMNNTITLRDMMSHRTGLPRHDLSWYFFNTPSIDSLVQRVQYMEPTFGVRERWQYNNFMFAAQGDIVEKITGKSWGDNIKQSFFVPLGMSRSDVTIADMEKAEDISVGYDLKKDSIIKKMAYYNIAGMSPAGAINSNVNDMAKWVIAWINNGKYQGKEIIPESFRNEAISSQSILDGSLPGKELPSIYFSNYGFGWFLDSYKGHYRVEHGGNIDGFSANTCFFPSDSVGIVVLSNQNNSKVPAIVRNIIADRLLDLKYHDWNSDLKNTQDKRRIADEKEEKENKPSGKHNPATHSLADFAGSYKNPGYGTFKIYARGDSLFLKLPISTLWLRHNNYDIFDLFIKDPKEGIDTSEMMGVKIQFHMNLSGDIDGLTSQLEDNLKPLLFTRVTESKAITAEEMQKYTGDYQLGGSIAKVYIKNSKALYLMVPGEGDFELIPAGDDKFTVKAMDGSYVQFTSQIAGKISGADLVTPKGTFEVKKK